MDNLKLLNDYIENHDDEILNKIKGKKFVVVFQNENDNPEFFSHKIGYEQAHFFLHAGANYLMTKYFDDEC